MASVIDKFRRKSENKSAAQMEPTDNESFGQALVDVGFGRGGQGSMLWPADDGGDGSGEFDRWFDTVLASFADRLDSPSDMMLKAKFNNHDDLRFASLCMELGDFELHAPCNNSARVMAALNLEQEETIRSIEAYNEGGLYTPSEVVTPSDPRWYIFNSIILVDCEDALADAEEQVVFLRNRQRALRQDMNRAKAGGWFVDYSYLSDWLMKQFDPKRQNNSAKLAQFPYHYRVLHAFCVQSPGGIYMQHEEAVLARMMVGVAVNDHLAMRNMQAVSSTAERVGGGGMSRSNNRGNHS